MKGKVTGISPPVWKYAAMAVEAWMNLSLAERIKVTREAQTRMVPLVERWSTLDRDVSDAWSPRAAFAARMLSDAESIADLGCGHMLLERFLRPDQRYVPVDLVARCSRTVVCDFNRDQLPALGVTHFAALGLLEYIYNLDSFLRAVRGQFVGGVATFYVCRGTTETERLGAGWVNHHTEQEIRQVLEATGFTIQEAFEWASSHLMFRLI